MIQIYSDTYILFGLGWAQQTQQVNLGSRDMAACGDAPTPVTQAASPRSKDTRASRGHVTDRQLTCEAGIPWPHVPHVEMHPSLSPGRISGEQGHQGLTWRCFHPHPPDRQPRKQGHQGLTWRRSCPHLPDRQPRNQGQHVPTFDNNTSECISEASQGQQIRVKLTRHDGRVESYRPTRLIHPQLPTPS